MYKYKIMKSRGINTLSVLKDIDFIVFHIKTKSYENYRIIAPLNYEDYPTYYKWLFKEAKKYGQISDNLSFEEFKRYLYEDGDDITPSITDVIDGFEYVRDYNTEDMHLHIKSYDRYFECII